MTRLFYSSIPSSELSPLSYQCMRMLTRHTAMIYEILTPRGPTWRHYDANFLRDHGRTLTASIRLSPRGQPALVNQDSAYSSDLELSNRPPEPALKHWWLDPRVHRYCNKTDATNDPSELQSSTVLSVWTAASSIEHNDQDSG